MKTEQIKIGFTSRLPHDLKKYFAGEANNRDLSLEEALEQAVQSWIGKAMASSSPIHNLTKEERYLVEGLIIGIRAKDPVIAGAAVTLKARIKEKAYEHK